MGGTCDVNTQFGHSGWVTYYSARRISVILGYIALVVTLLNFELHYSADQ